MYNRNNTGRKRVGIEKVNPQIDCGRFPIKRVTGEKVIVQADIFADGHDAVLANLLYRKGGDSKWRETPMRPLGNDRWQGEFVVDETGTYLYTIEGWIDHFKTWQRDLRKKFDAGQDLKTDILIGAEYLESASKKAPKTDARRLREFTHLLRNSVRSSVKNNVRSNVRNNTANAQEQEAADSPGVNGVGDAQGVHRATEAQGIHGASDGPEVLGAIDVQGVVSDVQGVISDVHSVISVALGQEISELMGRNPQRDFSTRYEKELEVVVDRKQALFSSWYERFPRSCSPDAGRTGTLKDCEDLLPEIAKLGFDVFYLTPIHPISRTNRKGKNNSPEALADDAGSPWAIGSDEGGHKAIHPQLGTLEDFERLVTRAREYGIEIAIDLAFQCGPDHPYIKQHPEWFKWRPDGTIQHAENPPKKYEDIVPLDFETEKWLSLWEELKSVVLFWIEKGVRIFRVDNPHTKTFSFWEWLIREIKRDYPEVILLAEAFTRPKLMYRLSKIGFTQSYTYFTWRNTREELTGYLLELTQTELKEYFRPNFWPNTPDILPEYLQYGGRPAFITRLILAATLSSSYGVYEPAFELCVNEAMPGKEVAPASEEYLNSEKYEIKYWGDIQTGQGAADAPSAQPESLRNYLRRINKIRKENPALQSTMNLRFYEVDNEYLLFYGKATEDLSNIILVVVNLDPCHTQSGWVKVPIDKFGISTDQPYLVHDLISEVKYIWYGEKNYVELNPGHLPAHIFRIRKRLKKETDFDYFV